MTDKAQAEIAAIRSRYEELAELAGSLAHEIKNPLSVIHMNIDLLSEDLAEIDSPIRRRAIDKVEIVSMNHGFAVDPETLPANAKETHRSLFDGSNCGIALTDRPAFSVQHHPEASPGPQDSHYLFKRFVDMMDARKQAS